MAQGTAEAPETVEAQSGAEAPEAVQRSKGSQGACQVAPEAPQGGRASGRPGPLTAAASASGWKGPGAPPAAGPGRRGRSESETGEASCLEI